MFSKWFKSKISRSSSIPPDATNSKTSGTKIKSGEGLSAPQPTPSPTNTDPNNLTSSVMSTSSISEKFYWMCDEQCTECFNCHLSFTPFRRRHHCRQCGRIFCGNCTSHRINSIASYIYSKLEKKRLCEFCYTSLSGKITKQSLLYQISRDDPRNTRKKFGLKNEDITQLQAGISNILNHDSKYFNDPNDSMVGRMIKIAIEINKNINPNKFYGDLLDIRNYVSTVSIVDALPHKNFEEIYSGVAFTCALSGCCTLKQIDNPKVLLVGCRVSYERSNSYSLLSSVVKQQQQYLNILVTRILKLNPDIIIFKYAVSNAIREVFERHNKVLLGDVSYSKLKALSRCTGASILNSTDEIGFAQLGRSKTFSIRKYKHLNKNVNVAIIDGCSPDLYASTILIHRNEDELTKIRRTFVSALFFTRFMMDELLLMKYTLPKLDLDSLPFRSSNRITNNNSIINRGAHRRHLTDGPSTSTSAHNLQLLSVTKDKHQLSNPDIYKAGNRTTYEPICEDIFIKNPVEFNWLPFSLFYNLYLPTSITSLNARPLFERNVWKMSYKFNNKNKLEGNEFTINDDLNLDIKDDIQSTSSNLGRSSASIDALLTQKLDMKPKDLANIPSNIVESVTNQMAIFRACGRFPSVLMLYSDNHYEHYCNTTTSFKNSPYTTLSMYESLTGDNESIANDSLNHFKSSARSPMKFITNHMPPSVKIMKNFSQQTLYSSDQYKFDLELLTDISILYYCYSSSSKIYPLFCVKPCIRQLKYYSPNDTTLLSFLMNHCFKSSVNCSVPLCERAYNMHSFVYVHANTKIIVRLPKNKLTLKSNLFKNNILYSYIKCDKCGKKSSYRKMPHESVNIPFSVFLTLIIYSKDYFLTHICENCHINLHERMSASFALYFQYNQNVAKFKILSIELYSIGNVSFSSSSKTGINILIKDLQYTYTNVRNALEEINNRFNQNLSTLPEQIQQLTADIITRIDNFIINSSSNVPKLLDVVKEVDCGQNFVTQNLDVCCKNINTHKNMNSAFYLLIINEIKASSELISALGFESFDSDLSRHSYTNKPNKPTLKWQYRLNSSSCPNLQTLTGKIPTTKVIRSISISQEVIQSTLYYNNNNNSNYLPQSKNLMDADHSVFSFHEGSSKFGHTLHNNTAKSTMNDVTSPAGFVGNFGTKLPTKNVNIKINKNSELNGFLNRINPLSKLTRIVTKIHINTSQYKMCDVNLSLTGSPNNADKAINYIINIGDPGRIASLAVQILNQSIAEQPLQHKNRNNYSIGLANKEGFFDVSIQVNDNLKYAPIDHTITNANHQKIEFDTNEDHVICNVLWEKDFKNFRHLLSKHDFFNEESYLESLNKCILWKAPSGKSKSNFFKSYDNRLIIKELTSHEFDCLQEFIINYISYISTSLQEQRPYFLVKIFGVYEIICKGSHNYRLRYIVMENLLHTLPFVIDPSKLPKQPILKDYLIFDLKGVHNTKQLTKSTPYVPGSIGTDAQLTIMSQSGPFYCTFQSGSIFQRAIERDTVFLSQQSIMDYSLLVSVDKIKKTINVGIIDFLRKYTWDKRLESVVKSSVMLRGANNIGGGPTVIHPEEYRSRFVEKMKNYFPPVPDKFSKYKTDFLEENSLFVADDENLLSVDIDKSKMPFWFHEILRMKTY